MRTFPTHLRTHRAARRGGALAATVLFLPLVFVLGAIGADWGRVQLARLELQAAADAAALHAVNGDGDSSPTSRAWASLGDNLAVGRALGSGDADVEAGTWNGALKRFTPNSMNALEPYAISVTARASVPLVFGGIVGLGPSSVSANAVAIRSSDRLGLVGLEGVVLNGTPAIDSYDGSAAEEAEAEGSGETYDAVDYYTMTSSSQASVMSNGPVSLVGDAMIFGDARPGPDQEPAEGGTVTGSRQPLARRLHFPAVDATEYSGANDNGHIASWLDSDGDLRLGSKDTLTLPGGLYVIRDLTMNGSATLVVAGKSTVFVTGAISAAGNFHTASNKAENLQIRVDSDETIKFSGGSDFFGHVYAPEAEVVLTGNADYYGTFIGRTMKVSGTSVVHQDKESANQGGIMLVR